MMKWGKKRYTTRIEGVPDWNMRGYQGDVEIFIEKCALKLRGTNQG